MTLNVTDHVMLPETDYVTSEQLTPAFSVEHTIFTLDDLVLKTASIVWAIHGRPPKETL